MKLDPMGSYRQPPNFDRNTPVPDGMLAPPEVMRPAQPNNIRELVQRLRGQFPMQQMQQPQQVAPQPMPEPQMPMRSVLQR